MASNNIYWAAPKPLSFDGNVSENFRKFEEHWLLFEKTELKGRTQEERCSYFPGEKGREVHKTLAFATPEVETATDGTRTWKRTTEQLTTAFRDYCSPKKNITYERHKFNTRNQEETESIDQYVTELRTLASTCEFENLKEGLIRDRVVCGIRNQALKERLLRECDLTLKKAVDICRAAEVSREQVKSLTENKPANVDALGKSTSTERERNRTARHNTYRPNTNTTKNPCGNCGRQHELKSCPAYGKKCNNCHKLGHFAKFCRSSKHRTDHSRRKPVREIEYDHYDSEASIHGIDEVRSASTQTAPNENVKPIDAVTHNEHASLKINNKTLKIKLESGAETNILTKADFDTVVPKPS